MSFLALLSAIIMASAWLVPSTITCSVLAWIGAILFCFAVEKLQKHYAILYAAGILTYSIGFYWLFFTIRDFGGFGNLAAFAIFLLFVCVSATQFLIFAFTYRNLPRWFSRFHLSTATAWVVAEYLAIKIFPWRLGHTQLAFSAFAQCADLLGVCLISFTLIWVSNAAVTCYRSGKLAAHCFLPFATFLALLCYGSLRVHQFEFYDSVPVNVALVQANISLENKHNIQYFKINAARYRELSKSFAGTGTLVVWPETVITEWIFAGLNDVNEDSQKRLPSEELVSFLIGSLTFQSEEQIYNSALGITDEGKILPPYHKQILMPFGEYTPFSETLPWLKDINSTAANFTAGKDVAVMEFPIRFPDGFKVKLKVSPLICYEDVDSSLSRKAVLRGAELLVNMTNDAWFGDTVAPYQHHLIATFRAIENRRFLLRSTNSGLTAVVDPLGKTVGSIKPFTEGIVQTRVFAINEITPFVYLDSENWVWYGCLWVLIYCVIKVFVLAGNRRKS